MARIIDEDGIFKIEIPKNKIYLATRSPIAELWHRKLRHLNRQSMRTFSQSMAEGIKLQKIEESTYVACIKAKHCPSSFPKESNRASEMMELHSDVYGPICVETPNWLKVHVYNYR